MTTSWLSHYPGGRTRISLIESASPTWTGRGSSWPAVLSCPPEPSCLWSPEHSLVNREFSIVSWILNSVTHRDAVILRVRAAAGAITLVSLPLLLRGVSLQEGEGHPGLETKASLKLSKCGHIIWCSVDLEKYILETKTVNPG